MDRTREAETLADAMRRKRLTDESVARLVSHDWKRTHPVTITKIRHGTRHASVPLARRIALVVNEYAPETAPHLRGGRVRAIDLVSVENRPILRSEEAFASRGRFVGAGSTRGGDDGGDEKRGQELGR